MARKKTTPPCGSNPNPDPPPKNELPQKGASKKTPPDFAYLEPAVAGQIGVHPNKLKAEREKLQAGVDWTKKGAGFWWCKAGLKKALKAINVPLAVVFPEERPRLKPTPVPKAGPWLKAKVVQYNHTNHRVITAEIEGKRQSVEINHQWRDLFRNGMEIEVQKSPGGSWRTRRPQRRGVF